MNEPYDAGLERERLAAEMAEDIRRGLSPERLTRFRRDLGLLVTATEIPAKDLYEMLRADARRLILEDVE